MRVSESRGAVLPNAEVRATGRAQGGIRVWRTDKNGVADLVLSDGPYDVSVFVTGFWTMTKHLDVYAGRSSAEEFVLRPGDSHRLRVRERSISLDDLSPSVAETGVLVQETISPSRPIPTGKAPGMQVKLLSKKGAEKVYAVIFLKGDEVLSGLTDFAIQYKVGAAHFTGIGAVSDATVGWLSLPEKLYHAIPVQEQVEVLSMMGDVATFNGKPVVHAHLVLGRQNGSTVGGHLWEAHANPTLEVFVSVDPEPLKKRQDDASGMKLIDPKQ